jgi:hypothetical protein
VDFHAVFPHFTPGEIQADFHAVFPHFTPREIQGKQHGNPSVSHLV